MADRVDQQLGNYRLIRLIGYGGFAEVYLGEHVFLKTQAAIKVLTIQLTSENMDGFQKEAQTIARLIHPHIVRVLEFGVEGATPYLVMDYAPNGTLRQKHGRGTRLTPAAVAPYIKQAAEALQYAHEQKLIHRDVKPENFLLGRNNEVLLSDFGIALVAQSSRHPGMQEVVGTVTYMAPEQIQGQPRPASDEYSLAIIAYEWLSGAAPFQGTFTELCTQHLYAPPAPLREKVPDLPPAVEEVVMTALAKEPKDRFATVLAFAIAFEQASKLDAKTYPASPTVVPPVVTPPAPLPQLQTPSQPIPSQPLPVSGQFTPTSGQMPPSLAQFASLSELPTTAMQLPVEPGKITPLPGHLTPSFGQLPPTTPQPTPTLGLSRDQIRESVFSEPTYVTPPPAPADVQTNPQPAQADAAGAPAPTGSTQPMPPAAVPAAPTQAAAGPALAPSTAQQDQSTTPALPTSAPATLPTEAANFPLSTPATFQAPFVPQGAETLPGWSGGFVAPVAPSPPPPSYTPTPMAAPSPLNAFFPPAGAPPNNAALFTPPPDQREKARRRRRMLVLALVVVLLFLGGGAGVFAFLQSGANPGVAINPTATLAPTAPVDTTTPAPGITPTLEPTASAVPTDTTTPQPTATNTPQPGPTNTPKPRPTATPKPPPALTAPAQISPCNGCQFSYTPHTLTFKWGSVSGASSYRLQVYRYSTGATSCSGGSLVLDTTLGGTSYSYTFVSAADQPGCWRVAAIGNGTQGPFSSLWFFVFTQ
jgi:serine/threonine protein kinase